MLYQFELFVENLCVEQELVTLHHLSALYVPQDIENSLKIALQIAHFGVSVGVVSSRLHTTTRARDGTVERSREIAGGVRFVLRVVALSLEAETRGQAKRRRVREGPAGRQCVGRVERQRYGCGTYHIAAQQGYSEQAVSVGQSHGVMEHTSPETIALLDPIVVDHRYAFLREDAVHGSGPLGFLDRKGKGAIDLHKHGV